MKILLELLALYEGEVTGQGPIELKDLIKSFPTNYQKAIEKLWGGNRLSLNGKPFFDEINSAANAAINRWASAGGSFTVNLSDVAYTNAEGKDFFIEINYEEPMNGMEGQEVYLGYNKKNDALYAGWDTSLNEEDLNSNWDEAFEKETEESFDYDNPLHQKAFNATHKEWLTLNTWIMFKLANKGARFEADDVHCGNERFYPEGYSIAKSMGLIDLRLD